MLERAVRHGRVCRRISPYDVRGRAPDGHGDRLARVRGWYHVRRIVHEREETLCSAIVGVVVVYHPLPVRKHGVHPVVGRVGARVNVGVRVTRDAFRQRQPLVLQHHRAAGRLHRHLRCACCYRPALRYRVSVEVLIRIDHRHTFGGRERPKMGRIADLNARDAAAQTAVARCRTNQRMYGRGISEVVHGHAAISRQPRKTHQAVVQP